MATYLLSFSPKYWRQETKVENPYQEWDQMIDDIQKGRRARGSWTCGHNKRIQKGDRVFFIKLGGVPRGVFASGTVVRGSYRARHWIDARKMAWYVDFECDRIVNPRDDVLEIDQLKAISDTMTWTPQSSGVEIPTEVAETLEKSWRQFLREKRRNERIKSREIAILPEEADMDKTYSEGARMRITVNRYERDPEARRRCIEYHLTRCSVCGISLEELYGEIGKGYIHVHHIRPLSECGKGYEVDPIKDLRPVCPNCHAMIHRKKRPFTIEQMRKIVEQYRNRRA